MRAIERFICPEQPPPAVPAIRKPCESAVDRQRPTPAPVASDAVAFAHSDGSVGRALQRLLPRRSADSNFPGDS